VPYARENATQRDNTTTAIAGSLASAIRFLVRQILTETGVVNSPQPTEELLENLQTDKGLGRRVILEFLAEIPGISDSVVKEQLANLKPLKNYHVVIFVICDKDSR
jgi:hypothetical protein